MRIVTHFFNRQGIEPADQHRHERHDGGKDRDYREKASQRPLRALHNTPVQIGWPSKVHSLTRNFQLTAVNLGAYESALLPKADIGLSGS